MDHRLRKLNARFRSHWRQILLFGVSGLLILVVIGQFIYPSDRLALFTVVDGTSFSSWQKNDAIKLLNDKYNNQTIPLYFGEATQPYKKPLPAEIGLTINNKTRIDSLNYPWYLRIIPTSILWAHFVIKVPSEPIYQRNSDKLSAYISKELDASCNIKPQDASLGLSDGTVKVIPSRIGGTCDIDQVSKVLSETKPQLGGKYRVVIPIKATTPVVSDVAAQQLADLLNNKVGTGIAVVVNGSSQIIPAIQVLDWIDFSSSDGKLTYTFNADRALVDLNQEFASKVNIGAGTTKVSMYNFTEASRVTGASGKKLDVSATLNSLKSFIDNGTPATVATMIVSPAVIYSYSYSSDDEGLSALMQNYAQTHSGVYGVSLIELSGQGRVASYNGNKSFTTASTYKLFVAYSSLMRIESGAWQWSDQIIDGRDLSACFDDMIVKSDNKCAVAMLNKIGHTEITNEAHAIGCNSTSFIGSGDIKTTAADLALLLAKLQNGQILTSQSSRDTLINAMKRNNYRDGIPAGISGSVVADKVGFLDDLLHDAAIVYSPTVTYVLVVMTDGSSWGNIANLARQIENLRTQ